MKELSETTTRAVKSRPKLLEKIEEELSIHTQIEEEIFYPAFVEKGGSEQREMYFEALEEHRAVEKLLLPDLKSTDPASDQYSGRVKVLKEMVEHHADEEEQEMFVMAKKIMSSKELDTLGQRMEARKTELKKMK